MRTVVAYDVADDYRRDRISRILIRAGDRVQKSVFECTLTASQRERLLNRIAPLLDEHTDSVRCYILCQTCANRTVARPAPVHEPVVVV